MNRIIVIGLDGATWDLLKTWTEKGELNSIKEIMSTGVWANLISTFPYTTCPAWTSFSTGKNPGKHGIFDFFSFKDKRLTLNKSKDIKCSSIYDMLSNSGINNVIINLPLSFPPPNSFKGIMISDFLHPIKSIIPNSKKKYLINYEVTPNFMKKGSNLLDDIIKTSKKQVNTAKELFCNEDWQFFFFLFQNTDFVCHFFWKDIIEITPRVEKIKEIFKIADNFIGWLKCKMENNDLLFIISDHGFGTHKLKVHPNRILKNKGLLRTKMKVDLKNENLIDLHLSRFNLKSRLFLNIENIKKILSNPLINKIFSIIGNLQNYKIISFIDMIFYRLFRMPIYKEIVDFDNSIAYIPTSGSMGVCVKKSEKIKKILIKFFKNLKYKEENVFKDVLMNKEVYSGKFANLGPDILLFPNGFFISDLLYNMSCNDIFTPKVSPGYHKLKGIFMVYGSEVKKGLNMSDFSIYDITPTILHAFDLPIPKNLDGNVLKMIYREDSEKAKRPIKYHSEMEIIKQKIKRLKFKEI